MKQNDSEEAKFDRHFDSVMKRLLDAGMIVSFSKRQTPCVVWNKKYQEPLGGRGAFLGMAILLAEICPDRPLSSDEQALIQMLRQMEEDESPEVA
jgi:hypothetical protein